MNIDTLEWHLLQVIQGNFKLVVELACFERYLSWRKSINEYSNNIETLNSSVI